LARHRSRASGAGGRRVRIASGLAVRTRGTLPPSAAAELVGGDAPDAAVVTRGVDGVEAIVHLAASTGVPDSVRDPATDFDTNVLGTFHLLRASVAASVRRFLVAAF